MLRPRAMMARKTLGSIAVGLLGVVGCGEEIGQSTSDVKDTFGKPTNQGELVFGATNRASFTEAQRFHAWTFELSADAQLDLSTAELAGNLDTVVYLYRREPGTSSWGAAVAKNDDDGGKLSSRVKGTFQAGEYQLKVKATKTAMRGRFSVVGACSGAGCPAGGGVCEPGDRFAPPAETGYGASCGDRAAAIWLEPVTSDVSEDVPASERCEAGSLGAKGVDLYRAYWDDLVGFEEQFGGDGEEIELHVRTVTHGDAGATVEVDAGGDEDLLAFVFDAKGDLVLWYHSEQSPVTGWFCAAPGDPEVEGPSDDCAGQALWAVRHRPDAARDDAGSVTAGSAARLGFLSPLAARFAEANGLASSASIGFERTTWTSIDGSEAGELLLSAGSASARYVATEDSLLLEQLGDGPLDFVCDEL